MHTPIACSVWYVNLKIAPHKPNTKFWTGSDHAIKILWCKLNLFLCLYFSLPHSGKLLVYFILMPCYEVPGATTF